MNDRPKNGSHVCDTCNQVILKQHEVTMFDHQLQKDLFFHKDCYEQTVNGAGNVFE